MIGSDRELAQRAWVEILISQNQRRSTLNSILPSQSDAEIIRSVASTLEGRDDLPIIGFVGGVPYACALPDIEIHNNDDDGLAYFEPRTGIARGLGLRDDSQDAMRALEKVMAVLKIWWERSGATGAKLLWPSSEASIEASLLRFNLAIDAYTEYLSADCPVEVHARARISDLGQLVVRKAAPADFEGALDIHLSVLDAHIPASPFAKRVSAMVPRYRERFLRATLATADPLNRATH